MTTANKNINENIVAVEDLKIKYRDLWKALLIQTVFKEWQYDLGHNTRFDEQHGTV